MIIGLDVMAGDSFGTNQVAPPSGWYEVCPDVTEWTDEPKVMEDPIVRCEDQ